VAAALTPDRKTDHASPTGADHESAPEPGDPGDPGDPGARFRPALGQLARRLARWITVAEHHHREAYDADHTDDRGRDP